MPHDGTQTRGVSIMHAAPGILNGRFLLRQHSFGHERILPQLAGRNVDKAARRGFSQAKCRPSSLFLEQGASPGSGWMLPQPDAT